jgi:hypothetical protein
MTTPLQPSELHKGPIRHPVLPDSFVDRIKAFKAILSDVDPTPLETAIDNFKRDSHPEDEIAIWERIANTYRLFLSHNAVGDPAIRKEVFAVLIGASMGSEDWSNIKQLNSDQINYLVANYRGLWVSVARNEQREIRVLTVRLVPDFASLNPGYACFAFGRIVK